MLKEINDKNNYELIEQLIKDDKLTPAEKILDEETERGVEWHCLKAVIYNKMGWLVEYKKELDSMKELAPNKSKYETAFKKYQEMLKYDLNDTSNIGFPKQRHEQTNGNNKITLNSAISILENKKLDSKYRSYEDNNLMKADNHLTKDLYERPSYDGNCFCCDSVNFCRI